MSETELKILFPTEKLDALRFFISKKGLTVEQELKDYLDKTYEKLVPAHVREYVESRLGQQSAQEETSEQEVQTPQLEPQRERRTRQSRRQHEQEPAETASAQESQMSEAAPDEEEIHGMSMHM